MPIDNNEIRKLDALKAAKAEATALARSYGEDVSALSDKLVGDFLDDGTQSVEVDGRKAYLHTDVYPKYKEGVEPEHVHAALIADGHGDLVVTSVNANTLAAHVRSFVDNEEELPENLSKVIDLASKVSVKVVQGSRSNKGRARRAAVASSKPDGDSPADALVPKD